MDQIDQQIARWHDDGKPQAIVTLVRVYGSAPQPLGARMAVTEDLQFIGAVSGGCVEGDVISQASGVLSTGRHVLKTYGISDEAAWDVGLACGGTIEVFIEPFTAMHEAILDLQHQQRLFCVITILSGPRMGEKQIVLPDGYSSSASSGLLSIGDLNHAVGRALSTQ
ncbi:MAG: XdhC family protein, partial [Anaerolineaceae bacterium]